MDTQVYFAVLLSRLIIIWTKSSESSFTDKGDILELASEKI